MSRAPRRRSRKPSARPPRKSAVVAPTVRGDLKPTHLASIRHSLQRQGVFDKIDEWRYGHERTRARVGRPEAFAIDTYLTILAAIIEVGDAPLLGNVAQAVRFRLPHAAADSLGITDDVYKLKDSPEFETFWAVKGTDDEERVEFTLKASTLYDRIQSANDRLSALVEPYPGVATRYRRTASEVVNAIDALDADEVAAKHERLAWLMNAIVRASLHRFPRHERRHILRNWPANVAIDGTKVPIYTKTGGIASSKLRDDPNAWHHCEAMAGPYVRLGDHAGRESDGKTPLSIKELRDWAWAYEAHIAVACSDGCSPRDFPRIALGIAFDSPGHRIGENSLAALTSATEVCEELGFTPDTVVADRAIMPNAKYEKFKQPALKMGWKFCHDYREDQLGKVEAPMGAIQIDGEFYCPGTPQALRDAAKGLVARKKKAAAAEGRAVDDADAFRTDDTFDQQDARRSAFALIRKELITEDGRGRYQCPASVPSGRLSCPLRDFINDGKTRIHVDDPPAIPGEICDAHRKTVAIRLNEKTGKYVQHYHYGSPRWAAMMDERETVEGFNAAVKDSNHEGLGEGARRQVIGMAKHAIMTALMVASTNVRRIRDYLYATRSETPDSPPDPGSDDTRPSKGTRGPDSRSGAPPPLEQAA